MDEDATREVLGNVERAMREATSRDDMLRDTVRADYPAGAGIVTSPDPAAKVAVLPPRPPRIELLDADGDAIRRFDADGPFEATLLLKARDGRAPDWLAGDEIPVVVTLAFPNADIARDHLRPIGNAVGILNDVLARAFAARTEDVPDAATCTHHVIIERFRRALPMQATCDRCLTVLVRDVVEWLAENGYDHLADTGTIGDSNRPTVAAIIQDAANRGR